MMALKWIVSTSAYLLTPKIYRRWVRTRIGKIKDKNYPLSSMPYSLMQACLMHLSNQNEFSFLKRVIQANKRIKLKFFWLQNILFGLCNFRKLPLEIITLTHIEGCIQMRLGLALKIYYKYSTADQERKEIMSDIIVNHFRHCSCKIYFRSWWTDSFSYWIHAFRT